MFVEVVYNELAAKTKERREGVPVDSKERREGVPVDRVKK
jgi:hypothetical protein